MFKLSRLIASSLSSSSRLKSFFFMPQSSSYPFPLHHQFKQSILPLYFHSTKLVQQTSEQTSTASQQEQEEAKAARKAEYLSRRKEFLAIEPDPKVLHYLDQLGLGLSKTKKADRLKRGSDRDTITVTDRFNAPKIKHKSNKPLYTHDKDYARHLKEIPFPFTRGVKDVKVIGIALSKEEFYNLGDVPEVAILGRSNVGKSTLLNALLGYDDSYVQKAVVSEKPGETRAIHFFGLGYNQETALPSLVLADMPGYGFAYHNEIDHKRCFELNSSYLLERGKNLKRVLLLLDARHGIKITDQYCLKALLEENYALYSREEETMTSPLEKIEINSTELSWKLQIVLTKCDLVDRKILARRVQQVKNMISEKFPKLASHLPIMFVSGKEAKGIIELQKDIGALTKVFPVYQKKVKDVRKPSHIDFKLNSDDTLRIPAPKAKTGEEKRQQKKLIRLHKKELRKSREKKSRGYEEEGEVPYDPNIHGDEVVAEEDRGGGRGRKEGSAGWYDEEDIQRGYLKDGTPVFVDLDENKKSGGAKKRDVERVKKFQQRTDNLATGTPPKPTKPSKTNVPKKPSAGKATSAPRQQQPKQPPANPRDNIQFDEKMYRNIDYREVDDDDEDDYDDFDDEDYEDFDDDDEGEDDDFEELASKRVSRKQVFDNQYHREGKKNYEHKKKAKVGGKNFSAVKDAAHHEIPVKAMGKKGTKIAKGGKSKHQKDELDDYEEKKPRYEKVVLKNKLKHGGGKQQDNSQPKDEKVPAFASSGPTSSRKVDLVEKMNQEIHEYNRSRGHGDHEDDAGDDEEEYDHKDKRDQSGRRGRARRTVKRFVPRKK